MLDYSDFEKIYCHGVEDYQNLNELKNKFILDEIKRRQDMVKDKESSIKQLQYENNLILEDICNVIKDDMFKSQKYNVLAYFKMEIFYDIFRYFNNQESFEEEQSSKYVEQTKSPMLLYGTDDIGEQDLIPYDISADPYNIAQRDENGQLNVPLSPTQNAHSTSKKYVDDLINGIKANQFIVIDADDYDPLQDFLDNYPNPQEGYIYLYPIDKNDLSKGYYQYIWEGSAWLDIGTTQIDLSDYYTKSESDTKFVAKTTYANRVYCTGSGGVPKLEYYTTTPANNTIPIRDENANILVGEPTGNSSATTKKYVDDKDALKVDKTTEHNKVYGTDNSGNRKL